MINKRLSLILAMLFLAACADNTPVSGPYPKTGIASWYSSKFTSTGERFNSNDLTCAIRKNNFGKYYKVCNISNDKCVTVRHNDFGPSKNFYNRDRIIDLTKTAFSRIADPEEGVIRVTVEEE